MGRDNPVAFSRSLNDKLVSNEWKFTVCEIAITHFSAAILSPVCLPLGSAVFNKPSLTHHVGHLENRAMTYSSSFFFSDSATMFLTTVTIQQVETQKTMKTITSSTTGFAEPNNFRNSLIVANIKLSNICLCIQIMEMINMYI
jgi:hypothetical protein